MTLLSRLPIFLLLLRKNKIYAYSLFELTDIIYKVISKQNLPNIIECVGPETFTFREILENLLKLIDKKRIYFHSLFY